MRLRFGLVLTLFFMTKDSQFNTMRFAFWFSIDFVFYMTKDSKFNTMRLRFGLVLTLCFT